MKKKIGFIATAVTIIITAIITNGTVDYSIAQAKTTSITKQTINQPKKILVPTKKVTVKKSVAPIYITVSEAKKMIALEIDDFIKQGKIATSTDNLNLTFDKLNNLNNSYSDDKLGFQPVYIQASAVSGVGTFLGANNISADNISSGSSATLNGLTVSSLASLNGGLSLTAPSNGNVIAADSGAYLSPGGTWTNASSKSLKENFTPLDGGDILQKIDALNITRWNYKKENSSTTHIGPVAEDFYKAFNVGGPAGEKSISTIDPAGISLIGIQALSKKITDLSWLTNEIKQFGIAIDKDLVTVKTLFADIIHTNHLEIGTTDLPTGITIYDKKTKQPMCMEISSGILQTKNGNCDTVSNGITTETQTITTTIVYIPIMPQQPKVITDSSSPNISTSTETNIQAVSSSIDRTTDSNVPLLPSTPEEIQTTQMVTSTN